MTDETKGTAQLYKPPNPNPAWELGAIARAAKVSRSNCPYTYPGKRWEWEAGWDWEDHEIGGWPMSADREEALKEAIARAVAGTGFVDRERLGFNAGYRAALATVPEPTTHPRTNANLIELLTRVEREVDPRSMLNVEVEAAIRGLRSAALVASPTPERTLEEFQADMEQIARVGTAFPGPSTPEPEPRGDTAYENGRGARASNRDLRENPETSEATYARWATGWLDEHHGRPRIGRAGSPTHEADEGERVDLIAATMAEHDGWSWEATSSPDPSWREVDRDDYREGARKVLAALGGPGETEMGDEYAARIVLKAVYEYGTHGERRWTLVESPRPTPEQALAETELSLPVPVLAVPAPKETTG